MVIFFLAIVMLVNSGGVQRPPHILGHGLRWWSSLCHKPANLGRSPWAWFSIERKEHTISMEGEEREDVFFLKVKLDVSEFFSSVHLF